MGSKWGQGGVKAGLKWGYDGVGVGSKVKPGLGSQDKSGLESQLGPVVEQPGDLRREEGGGGERGGFSTLGGQVGLIYLINCARYCSQISRRHTVCPAVPTRC